MATHAQNYLEVTMDRHYEDIKALMVNYQKLILENKMVLEELEMECQKKINEDMAYALSYINLFAAIVVAIFIAWKKELVYRDVKQGSNEIKFVKPWVLPPVLYIHNRAWRKVYQLGKIFLCPPFCFPSFFYRYT